MNEPGVLVFGGKVISDLPGMQVFAVNIDGAPARVYNKAEMPGKNGEILIDDMRYKNISHIYSFVIKNDTENYTNSAIEKLRQYVLKPAGYQWLYDSWHTGETYEAYLPDGLNITVSQDRLMAKGELRFERTPQRYYRSGLDAMPVDNGISATLVQDIMPSLPYITITSSSDSSGTFVIAEMVSNQPQPINTILASNLVANETIYIDCETGTITSSITGNTMKISFSNGFPVLSLNDWSPSRTFAFYTTGDLTGTITPRWWTL